MKTGVSHTPWECAALDVKRGEWQGVLRALGQIDDAEAVANKFLAWIGGGLCRHHSRGQNGRQQRQT